MMGYSSQVYAAAQKLLRERKDKAEDELPKKKAEIYRKHPELERLDRALTGTLPKLTMLILSHDNSKDKITEIQNENISLNEQRNIYLSAHDIPSSYDRPDYTCKKCNDTGFVGPEMCSCLRELIDSLSFDKLCAESNMELTDFDSFSLNYYPVMLDGVPCRENMKKTLEFCKKYAFEFSHDSTSLLFCGRTGLGKSHLSLAIASKVIKSANSVVYVSAPGIFRSLEKERFGSDEERQNTFDTLITPDLLIIDDLGAEFSTQFTNSMLYDLVNTRINRHLPMIINTNLSPAELDEKYSERIVSRLLGCFSLFLFTGKDIRIERLKSK